MSARALFRSADDCKLLDLSLGDEDDSVSERGDGMCLITCGWASKASILGRELHYKIRITQCICPHFTCDGLIPNILAYRRMSL